MEANTQLKLKNHILFNIFDFLRVFMKNFYEATPWIPISDSIAETKLKA